jgi:hypothetical protein
LAAHPEGQDDDQIGEALHIDRHQINAICRGLAEADAIRRGKPATGGKVLNQPAPQRGTEAPAVHNTFSPPPAIVPTPSVTIPSVTITGPLVWLSDSHAMQLFAYDGTANLTEDAVKAAVKHVLEADGWRTEVHFGHIHGIDIEAVRGDERFVLEAKGEGSSDQQRGDYFDGALGELLRRMNAPDARYGLALPAHRRFTGLVRLLPLWIRQRLDLWFFFVRPTVDGLEVGVFAPDARRSHL